jgi:hypothetical protein
VLKKGLSPSSALEQERFGKVSVEEQEELEEQEAEVEVSSDENQGGAASEPPTKKKKLSRLDMFHLHVDKQKVKPTERGRNPFIVDEASVNTRADKAEVMYLSNSCFCSWFCRRRR